MPGVDRTVMAAQNVPSEKIFSLKFQLFASISYFYIPSSAHNHTIITYFLLSITLIINILQ